MLSNIKRFLAACTVVATFGCAPAYNCYECGCTPYDYCRRAPLPHSTYDSCCQTPIAKSYAWSSEPSTHLAETLSVELAEAPVPPTE